MALGSPSGATRNVKRAKKVDLSRYLDGATLTDRQYEYFSLKFESAVGSGSLAGGLLVRVTSRYPSPGLDGAAGSVGPFFTVHHL